MEITLEEFKQELRGGARAIVQFRHAERPKMDPDDPSFGDAAQVLEVFQPKNFFPACFEYFATGEQRGFKNLYVATEECEKWLEEKAKTKLLVVATHDVYIAAFLYAKGAVRKFSQANWPRFLDGAAIIHRPDGSTVYALVRTGLSDGIVGVRREDVEP